jgi:peptidoglycan/xylan/chitin deacetylase (PgdA/CDA1 family)
MMPGVKRLLGQSMFATRLDAVLLRNAAVVVMFHRVKDGTLAADSLTVDVATFERYCQYFKQHFRVLPLGELVQRLEERRSLSRALAITFDDGYRDNFDNAAPVLERLGLPATFFVVTQWMETDVVPFWDGQAGVRHPWMTWAQIRSLRDRGFEIGVHTRTHVDLGQVTGPEAVSEIAGARADLERRLATSVTSFAYPFGGRNNFTDANRELVKTAGFRCCCSGYGGVNPRGTSPFNLHRVPITGWYASPHQFGFDLAFGRTLVNWSPSTH